MQQLFVSAQAHSPEKLKRGWSFAWVSKREKRLTGLNRKDEMTMSSASSAHQLAAPLKTR